MNHIISLLIGDESGDGHSKTDTINIRSNLSKKDIDKAYKSGTKKLGFDFCSEVSEEYEDRSLDADKWARLKEFKYRNDALEEEAEKFNKGEISLWIDSFADIYLFIVKLGNEDFQFEYLTGDQNPTIAIGGYGLYCD